MTFQSRGARDNGVILDPPPATLPRAPHEQAGSPGHACSDPLPRDILIRLADLARQLSDVRRDHALDPDLALRLDDLAAGMGATIQSIYDGTAEHFAGRRR